MKRYIKLLISCVLLVLSTCFAGCSNTAPVVTEAKKYDKYTCLVTDISLGDVSVPIELTYDTSYYQSETAPKSKAVTFQNKRYSGTYKESQFTRHSFYSFDRYKMADGSEFRVRTDNGKLIFISFTNKDYYETAPLLPDVDSPEAESLRIAKEAASDFVNISDYEIIPEDPIINTKNITGKDYTRTLYVYNFMKKIDGIDTTDMLRISVDSKGKLLAVSTLRIGEFKKYEGYDVPLDKCYEIVEQKVKGLYNEKYLEHVIRDMTLVLTDANQLALSVDVLITLDYEDPTGADVQSAIEVIIFLE